MDAEVAISVVPSRPDAEISTTCDVHGGQQDANDHEWLGPSWQLPRRSTVPFWLVDGESDI